jgi:hypothetical protein
MTLSTVYLATPVSTGGAGASTATVTGTVPVHGAILSVYLKYNDTPPAGTTDVTLTTTGTASNAPPAQTILSVSNAATNGYFYPRVPEHLASTGAAITDSYDWPIVYDTLTLTIAQANDGDSVEAWVTFEAM